KHIDEIHQKLAKIVDDSQKRSISVYDKLDSSEISNNLARLNHLYSSINDADLSIKQHNKKSIKPKEDLNQKASLFDIKLQTKIRTSLIDDASALSYRLLNLLKAKNSE
ncbi:MAG: hypothetical protein MHPSP_002144, partial [Paramarteilia canceri]